MCLHKQFQVRLKALTELTKDRYTSSIELSWSGGIYFGWLSGFWAQTGTVISRSYTTIVGHVGEATMPEGGKCGPCPDFALCTLVFALQLRKNHGKTTVRARLIHHAWTQILEKYMYSCSGQHSKQMYYVSTSTYKTGSIHYSIFNGCCNSVPGF
jgi:hypothetical protein